MAYRVVTLLAIVALSMPLVGVAEDAHADDAKSAQAAFEAFRDHLKAGKIDDAFELLASIPDAPDEYPERIKSKLERLAAPLKAGTRGMEIVDAKTDGDAAVVVIREVKANAKASKDLDPAYLVRQDGKWRIIPGLTQYDTSKIGLKTGLEDATLKRFAGLSDWFKDRKSKANDAGE